ncbi:MAG: BrnT family toxin [Nitrospirae bacterium]|nr:BrnT family toxin [Nitrospirota bacterium]
MNFDFDWDPGKAKANMQKHGVAFEEAATVMHDPRAMNMYDPDHSESEDRWITLGISSSGRLLVVCHTFTEGPAALVTVRIYSARRPSSKEIKTYEGA